MVEAVAPLIHALEEVDDSLHQKARLGVMATLAATGEASFHQLREALRLTDGNLSAHLSTLERKGYVHIEKSFVGKRPHTSVRATEAGARAFDEYLTALESVVTQARGQHHG